MRGKVWVIGAGLAGLAAATRLAAKGAEVEVIESASQAGGRCRSYVDPVLETTLDNGNHLVLSGNRATFEYLHRLGSEDRLVGPSDARLDFHDLSAGERWTIRPNPGPLAWWTLAPGRRVPGSRASEYAALVSLIANRRDRPVEQVIACKGALWDRLVEPFLLAALNTPARCGSAALAGAVIRESLARGGAAYRPRVAHPSLSAAFVDPALTYLADRGARVRLGEPVRGLVLERERLTGFATAAGETRLGPEDTLVLATPPWISRTLVPGLTAPDVFSAIVNGHFKIPPPRALAPIVGVIGGTAEWIFAFPDRLSVTVSAAGTMADENRESLALRFWRDIAAVHGLSEPMPPWRIVKERRATFAATPAQNALRPPSATRWRNLWLAGDWTDTGLPATIEGAIRSGDRAAALALKTGNL